MAMQMQINIRVEGGTVKFDPSPLNVQVGDQIFWTNNDSQPHWPGLRKENGSIDEKSFMPNQIAGGSTSSIFSPGVAGKLKYVCSLHCKPGGPCNEEGTIEVVDDKT